MVHVAEPATDGSLGRQRSMGIRDMISLILFLAFLALFAGLMTGVVSGDAVFSVVRDGISKVGDALAKLLG